MKWSQFYGTTAEKFLLPVRPTEIRHTTRKRFSFKSSREPTSRRKAFPSKPRSASAQRPPQFDYIYRANESAKDKAEKEAAYQDSKVG